MAIDTTIHPFKGKTFKLSNGSGLSDTAQIEDDTGAKVTAADITIEG